jgi:hypothetical protein
MPDASNHAITSRIYLPDKVRRDDEVVLQEDDFRDVAEGREGREQRKSEVRIEGRAGAGVSLVAVLDYR